MDFVKEGKKYWKTDENLQNRFSWPKKFKKFFRDFWFLLWKDDSLKGWIFSIIFIFVFIKFIFFPVLSLATGTVLPLAIVESCSMYHSGDFLSSFSSWWDRHENKYSEFNLDKSMFSNFNLKKGFNKGDILFIVGANPEKLKIGDVIIFEAGHKNPIIHRIINIKEKNGEKIFLTIGDNNNGQLSVEKEISEEQIIGKAVFKLAPLVGWGKLIFFEIKQPPEHRGFCSEN